MSDIVYNRVNWEDSPSTNTPINSTNLNVMDKGIEDVANEVNNRISYENLLTLDECNAVTEPGKYTADAMALAELGKSVSDGKSLVATAITGRGVATTADATFKVMADNVNKISTFKQIGSYNGATTFDIKNYSSNYAKLTADNFFLGCTYCKSGYNGSNSYHRRYFAKSYNASTGILTISCTDYDDGVYANQVFTPDGTFYVYMNA